MLSDQLISQFRRTKSEENQDRSNEPQVVWLGHLKCDCTKQTRNRDRDVDGGSVQRDQDRRESRRNADEPMLLRNEHAPAAQPPDDERHDAA